MENLPKEETKPKVTQEEKKEEVSTEKPEEENKELVEEKHEDKEEPKKEEIKKEEEKPEEPKEEVKEEAKEPIKEEAKEEAKEQNEEKELSPEEEDKKDLYEGIQDLKPEEASANIKSKLILMTDVYLDCKKVEREQYNKEYDILQDKYDKKYQEIDDKIDMIANSTEKIELTQEEKDLYGIKDDEEEIKPMEDYWEKVIINSLYFTITDRDKVILKYLSKVKKVKSPDNINDFRIDFYFKQNEFFSNEVLSKKYIYGKDAVLKKAEGTKIEWKSKDKDTTVEKIKKKIKKGKKHYFEEKEQKVDSFFSFFSQVDDMNFIQDEVTFFKEDLFMNQLEYYLNIVSKTKNGGLDDENDDDYGEGNQGYEKEENDKKKEECKQQ